MLFDIVIPAAVPVKPIPGYQMPTDSAGLLGWDFVATQMEQTRYYWISTVGTDDSPHVAPLWGIWYRNRVHFDGSPQTAWARHLMRNPRIAVHLPSGDQVVIIEGQAFMLGDGELDAEGWQTIDTVYQTKYAVLEGSPYWYVQPHKVLAWNGADLRTMTRWVFAAV